MLIRTQRTLSSTLIYLFVFLIFFRLTLQHALPVLGDEAYYFYWGHHFSGGYYDLPPMIGWWERLFTAFSDEPFWLRIPNLLVFAVVAFGIREWLSVATTRIRASTTSLLYFLSPLPFFAVFVTHDLSLLIFSFYSALLFYRGFLVKRPWKEFLFSGVLWGAAFLSKYFAVFSIPFYLIWFFTRPKDGRSTKMVGWFLLGAFPFLFQHLYWNAQHCWANFVFNLIIRQQVNDGPVYQTFGFFILYLLILITPVFWPEVFRLTRKAWFRNRSSLEMFFLGMWLVPILIFALTALLGRGQGLHWYLPYLPFFFMWIGMRLPLEGLQKKMRQMMLMTGTLSLVILVSLVFPDQTVGKIFSKRFPLQYEITFHGREWVEKILDELNTSIWGETDLILADGYSQASILDHEIRRFFTHQFFWRYSVPPPIAVWGGGSRFGRVYDWTVDFSKFEGKNVALVSRTLFPSHEWSQFFDESRISQKEVRGQFFWMFMGRGFHARNYIDQVMRPSWKKHYLPFFMEKWIPSSCQMRSQSYE